MISKLVLFNGIYDILCAFSILGWPLPFSSFFAKLHPTMFLEEMDVTAKRILAYWILTYGCIRLYAGIYFEPTTRYLAVLTYILEGLFFLYENQQTKMNQEKVWFVTTVSFLFAFFISSSRFL